MYKHYVNKRKPISIWMLDDTVPFQEQGGFGASGGKKSGTTDPTKSVPLVSGALWSSVFKAANIGQFDMPLFKVGLEQRPFVLEAWVLPVPKTTTSIQQILSHDGVFDGLSINGKVIRFGTQYATYGTAYCDYDLQDSKAAHVVGIHNADENQLWVNGELVASVTITDDQKGDVYFSSAAAGTLYSGYTTSTAEIAMNAVAFYPSLSGEQIRQNYAAGIDVLPQARVASQYGGLTFGLNAADGAVFLNTSWVDSTDFVGGLKNNVEYAPDQIEPSYSAGLSVAGTWTTAVPLDGQGDTSIYGVMVQWSGKAVTVHTSLDGTTWTAAVNGELISTITSGYNPTGKDLQIRVSMGSGVAVDPAYLESLTVIGYRNNSVANISARTATVSYPAVLRGDYEPILYRDDNGLNLKGGTLTIGTDTSPDPEVARVLELWIKPLSATAPTNSVGGTSYRNGAADATLPRGEWSLIHRVAASDISGSITVTGDCIVGQAALYPTPLSAGDIATIYSSYTGGSFVRFTDTGLLSIAEAAVPAKIYAHDWGIDGAG